MAQGDTKILKLSDGRYGSFIELPRRPDGRRRRKFVSGQTRAVVVRKRDEVRRNLAIGVVSDEALTVCELVADHLNSRVGKVAKETHANYVSIASKHIKGSSVGATPIARLSAQHVEALLEHKREIEQLSPRSVNRIRFVLLDAMQAALERKLVPENVVRWTHGYQLSESTVRAMSDEQALAFSATAGGSPYEAAYAIMLSCGLRPGECFGLGWPDLDLKGNMATIRGSLKPDGTLGSTKNRPSRRTIPVPSYVGSLLLARKEQQANDRRRAGKKWRGPNDSLVFTTNIGTPLNLRNVTLRDFRPLCAKSGIGDDWTLHELRHTAATLMLLKGVPIEQVSRMLGHSSIRVTADYYGHIAPRHLQSIADTMDELFGT